MEPVDIALNLLADTFPRGERVRVRKTLADVLVPALASMRAEAAP
jgi:dihydroxyacetone kinase